MIEFLEALSNYIGIAGVLTLLSTYYLLSVNKISSHNFLYPLSNFIGSSFILFSLYFNFNLPSFIIELAWMTISIIGMVRVYSHKTSR